MPATSLVTVPAAAPVPNFETVRVGPVVNPVAEVETAPSARSPVLFAAVVTRILYVALSARLALGVKVARVSPREKAGAVEVMAMHVVKLSDET